jgi:uncharacterized membrane protein (DUF106 family)
MQANLDALQRRFEALADIPRQLATLQRQQAEMQGQIMEMKRDQAETRSMLENITAVIMQWMKPREAAETGPGLTGNSATVAHAYTSAPMETSLSYPLSSSATAGPARNGQAGSHGL